MAKSRSHGESSSASGPQSELASRTLAALSSSPIISKISQALGADSQLHLVGGIVRDLLLGLENSDIDPTTVLLPDVVAAKLRAAHINTYETGLKHGTLTAVVDDLHVEITTFRSPDRGANSRFSDSIEEDLSGRDFTINAIAYDVFNQKVIDPWGGQEDLINGFLRGVGSPQDRLNDDPLRLMRFVRFGAASGRKADPALEGAVKHLAAKLTEISVERVRSELEKILISTHPKEALRKMVEVGILEQVIPELLPSVGFEQNRFHTEDVFEHTLTVIAGAPPTVRMRLAALFHDIGKPASMFVDETGTRRFHSHEEVGYRMTKEIMKRLRFSNEEIEAVSQLVKLHMRPIDCGPPGVRRLIRDLGELYPEWRLLKVADAPPIVPRPEFEANLESFDRLVESERRRLAKVENKLIIVGGRDILELGIKPGPQVGRILKALEEIVIENLELNTREILIERAKQLILGGEI